MFYKIVVPGPEPGTYLSCHGGTHTWVPGVTYGPVPVAPCCSGFHACRARDLTIWLADGMVVFEVELAGVVVEYNKVVGSTATLGRRLGTLTLEGMVEFARRCAGRTGVGAVRYVATVYDAGEVGSSAADAAAYAADRAGLAAGEAAACADADAAYRAERELQGQDILSLLVP